MVRFWCLGGLGGDCGGIGGVVVLVVRSWWSRGLDGLGGGAFSGPGRLGVPVLVFRWSWWWARRG